MSFGYSNVPRPRIYGGLYADEQVLVEAFEN